MIDKNFVTVNLTALQKLVEEEADEHEKEVSELQKRLDTAVQQYNQVVLQNKNLQTECNVYRKTLEEVRIMATKYLTVESFVNIQNKINEVL